MLKRLIKAPVSKKPCPDVTLEPQWKLDQPSASEKTTATRDVRVVNESFKTRDSLYWTMTHEFSRLLTRSMIHLCCNIINCVKEKSQTESISSHWISPMISPPPLSYFPAFPRLHCSALGQSDTCLLLCVWVWAGLPAPSLLSISWERRRSLRMCENSTEESFTFWYTGARNSSSPLVLSGPGSARESSSSFGSFGSFRSFESSRSFGPRFSPWVL